MGLEHPRVFISYSHDSEEHKDRVLQLAHQLRGDGMDARLDQFVNGTPAEGWPRWMRNEIKQAQFVLVVCTETFRRRAEREEEPGRGHGVIYESLIAEADIYANGSKNTKFMPIYFQGSSSKNVPDFLQTWTYYPITKLSEYETLRRVLTDQPLTPMPPLGKGATLPPKMVGDLFGSGNEAGVLPHSAPAPFTVCILATQGDLAEIQASSGNHLGHEIHRSARRSRCLIAPGRWLCVVTGLALGKWQGHRALAKGGSGQKDRIPDCTGCHLGREFDGNAPMAAHRSLP